MNGKEGAKIYARTVRVPPAPPRCTADACFGHGQIAGGFKSWRRVGNQMQNNKNVEVADIL